MEFTHFDEKGASRMVDVSGKAPTKREATATGRVTMHKDTLQQIVNMSIKKGNVFEVARIAAIMAVKQTPHLIPLCHPLAISKVNVEFNYNLDKGQVDIQFYPNLPANIDKDSKIAELHSLGAISQETMIENLEIVKDKDGELKRLSAERPRLEGIDEP